MTDAEIIEVVTAHKEGKQIECVSKATPDLWVTCHPHWNFDKFNYRVKPNPYTHLWLQDIGDGLWQEKFWGLGRHFVLDRSDASHLKYVESTTVEPSPKSESEPRKPREWWICNSYGKTLVVFDDPLHPHSLCSSKDHIHVREVIEE